MNLIGTVLADRYEITDEVGSGGMAVVYKAKDRLLNRYIAVKVLRPDLKDDADFVRRFNIEAQSAASLTHPNIVSIYDVGTDGDIHYIVMEYIEGITLKDYIDSKGELPWREALGYAIQIARGLEQAHKNSIVHRDIKPHNIIMTADGTLKITDFGIARASLGSTVTCDDNAIGSVHYVSPEQARGGYVDARSDIYSLGVVMYEMLTGKVPYDNESPVTIALMHLQSSPTPPRELNLSIPKAVEDIVLRAMSKEVSGRYPNITEMIDEMQYVLEHNGSAPSTSSDELGGNASFSVAPEKPSDEELYASNQTPSYHSNLILDKDKTPSVSSSVDEIFSSHENIPAAPSDSAHESNIKGDMMNKKDSNDSKDKNAKIQKNVKKRKVVVISALSVSLIIIIAVGSIFWPYIKDVLFSSSDMEYVTVPQFVNMSYDDVMDKYGDDKRFDFSVEYDEDKSEDDGTVLKQNPKVSSKVETANGTIEVLLTVNRLKSNKNDKNNDNESGSDVDLSKEKLASFEHKKYDSVKGELSDLEDMGITVKIEEKSSETYDRGYIIKQSVPKGTALNKFKTLTLTVSTGSSDRDNQEATPTPTPTKTPTPTAPPETQMNRKRFTIYGPSDKASANVVVKVNGSTIKSLTMAKDTSEVVTIQSASPSVNVEVFHDGVLVMTQTVNMTD